MQDYRAMDDAVEKWLKIKKNLEVLMENTIIVFYFG